MKTATRRKSPLGGACGNGGAKGKTTDIADIKKETIMKSIQRYSLRMLVYRLFLKPIPGPGKNLDYDALTKMVDEEIERKAAASKHLLRAARVAAQVAAQVADDDNISNDGDDDSNDDNEIDYNELNVNNLDDEIDWQPEDDLETNII